MRKIKIESAVELTPHQIASIKEIFSEIPITEPKRTIKGEIYYGTH